MTLICKHCGCENHLEADKCTECGEPINKEEIYVVCTTCGISNPQSAKTCIGCGEPLNRTSTFILENTVENDKDGEEVLSIESTGVVKKEKIVKEKKGKNKFKEYAIVGVLGLLIISFIVLLISWLSSNKMYLEAEDGFYYVTDTGILHVIDDTGKDIEVGYDVKDPKVYKYGKTIYYLNNQELYVHKNGAAQLIASQVNSFKVNFKGREVLYTVASGEDGLGDLFKYDGKETLRIDGAVGIYRYVFGQNDDVYYVSEITDDENLGVLYMKRDSKASVKITDDVYEPLFSLKKDSVYYVRESIDETERFDLFYVKNGSVTEVSRNVTQIHVNPIDETFKLIQYKNEKESLISVLRNESNVLQSDIKLSGIHSFGDAKPLQWRTDLTLMLQLDDGTNCFSDDKEIHILDAFDTFTIANEGKKIYTVKNNELFVSDFNGTISNTISLARDASIKTISESGKSIVYHTDKTIYRYEAITKELENVTDTLISINEKYLIYLENKDAYVNKNGANEPVFLGDNVLHIKNLGNYVYTFKEDELSRYKLGKFSSNKSVAAIRTWQVLELAN